MAEVPTETRIVRRLADTPVPTVGVDIAVLGAGSAGLSAALEAARLGHRVALIDGQPSLGGQAVHSVIGTFCGLYSNGPEPYQVTGGIADEILADLGAEGALNPISGRRNTRIVQYDEVALARWVERRVTSQARITPILGAMARAVERDGRRLTALHLATRHGDLRVAAEGFVDASGDAVATWLAGLECREPVAPVHGTQVFILEGIDEARAPHRDEIEARLKETASAHGLVRLDGFVFVVPGTGRALVNMTHVKTPLDPVGATAAALAGRAQADRVLDFLRREFPAAFAEARVRIYGQLGIRQTRWIVGGHQLGVEEVRAGTRFDDAVLRCSWPIELHHDESEAYWEVFGDDHLHQVPLRSLLPPEADNLVAAGRVVDGDVAALSSVRVMGPCIAMGAAAAHALDLAGAGSVHQIDIARLQDRLADNLVRRA